MLGVIASFVAKPGLEEELRQLLVSLLAPTRAEEGCLEYVLWQDQTHPGRLTLIERWRNHELLTLHLDSPHLRHAKMRFAELLAEPLTLRKLDLIG